MYCCRGEQLTEIDNWQPDVYLLDVRMSGCDGPEIAQQLRLQMTERHIPIMLFSANRDIAKIAEQAKVDDYLAKPFDVDQLLAKIDRCLLVQATANLTTA